MAQRPVLYTYIGRTLPMFISSMPAASVLSAVGRFLVPLATPVSLARLAGVFVLTPTWTLCYPSRHG